MVVDGRPRLHCNQTKNTRLLSCQAINTTKTPPSRDTVVFNSRLILARLRFESGGGRLPGSGGQVLVPPPSASITGKKRALPSWGGGSTSGGSAKQAPSPSALKAATTTSLFTPSYTPPPSSTLGKAHPVDVATPTAKSSEPWTPDVVLRIIKEAGPSGASLEVKP